MSDGQDELWTENLCMSDWSLVSNGESFMGPTSSLSWFSIVGSREAIPLQML